MLPATGRTRTKQYQYACKYVGTGMAEPQTKTIALDLEREEKGPTDVFACLLPIAYSSYLRRPALLLPKRV